jgi:hypothetical protein
LLHAAMKAMAESCGSLQSSLRTGNFSDMFVKRVLMFAGETLASVAFST